jgi:hypothetical protein
MAAIRELSTPEKKRAFLKLTQSGLGRIKSANEVGVTIQAVDYWRRQDAAFRESDDRIKLVRQEVMPEARDTMPDFEEFCMKYLDTKLFNHHLQWVDLLEGREPRNLHPAQRYEVGTNPDFILINTPPEHAKSTTITVNYVTYRICQDPNIRVIIVSQTQEMAKRFLRAIKDRLASPNPNYRKLQIDFAPDGGFDANSAAWTADSIYVNPELRDSGEASPTVQALGIGGHIYGSRCDLMIFDDTVTGKNAHEYLKQMDWMQREVYNRNSQFGAKMLLIGTRLAPTDLYGEIIKPEYYNDEESPWTYLTQPAVLEFDEDPEKWVTLWPRTNRPPVSLSGRNEVVKGDDGLYPMWNGGALKKRRASMSPRNWALVYQQEKVVDDAIFGQKAVMGSVDNARQPGPMGGGTVGGRPNGIEGCYVVGGFDPAMTGHSAAVVIAMDRNTGIRWVLDVWTRPNCKPDDLFDKIKEWTVKYRMNEWRIEKNAMNLMVTQNREIRSFLATRGCLLREHFTGSNKWDSDFGVASMSMLFDGWEQKKQLIHLPNKSAEGVRMLIEQLTTWEPEPPGSRSRRKTDCVMALWFAEIRCRELVDEASQAEEFHVRNSWLSERDRNKQMVIDLDYMSQSAMHGDSTMEWWSG